MSVRTTQPPDLPAPSNASEARDRRLDGRHLAELRRSGLTDETIRKAGVYSAAGDAIATILSWRMKGGDWGSCLVFPFRGADGVETSYARVKPDFPRTDEDDRIVKYESPRKQQNRAYFPPGFVSAFAPASDILITEGEKKTLAAWQAGFCCIGLIGVWGFQKRRLRDDRGKVFGARQLIADLAALDWRGKQVVIVFDSDVADRSELQIAEFRLAELLAAKKATVRVVRLPQIGADKTGLDDFMVHHADAGAAELLKLMAAAQEAELPKATGPMDLAKILIEESFTGATGLTLRYWRGDFWRFTGRAYEQASEDELTARVLKWVDARGLEALPRRAADVVKCLVALCIVQFNLDMPLWLDGERHEGDWGSFANGLFRIGEPSTIQFQRHTARYFSPWSLDYPFDPKAECPLWIVFLNDVLDADPERIDLLQRWFGLLLTPDTSFQKLLLFVGPPRSGKGTICRILLALIGKANCASPSLSSLGTRFGFASLMTKVLAIMPDAHIGKHADSIRIAETLKPVVGEDPQDIDRKYKDPLNSVRLPTRFVISCNEIAHFSDPSGALAARVSALTFFNTYQGREDRTLERRLRTELSGILNWAIVGLARLRTEGRLNEPEQCVSVTATFRVLSSPIAAFCDECIEFHPDFKEVSTEAAYAAWIGWAKANGHEAGSNSRFGERLRTVNPRVEKTRVRTTNDEREYRYRGIRLTSSGNEYLAEGMRIHEGGN